MFVIKEKLLSTLKMNDETFETYNNLNLIRYSYKTDKYDYSSLLQTRTMTIGLEKSISTDNKALIFNKMREYSSYKHKLTSLKSQDVELKNSGTNRLHREIAKKYNLSSLEADSCLKSVDGIFQSAETWYFKTISYYEKRIISLEEKLIIDLEKNKNGKSFHPNYFKGKRENIERYKLKLEKLQRENRLKIHYGKSISRKLNLEYDRLFSETKLKKRSSILKNIKRLKAEYEFKRLEYFVEGSKHEGNKKVNIEYSDNGYQLKIKINKKHDIIIPISVPRNHFDTFSLDGINRQSMRISLNSKGKIVLNCTYSYLKPIQIEKIDKSMGTIGIDLNPTEITCVYVKNDGNPYKKISYNIANILEKRNEDTIRELSLVLDKIISDGIYDKFYSITIENLNFKDEKYKNNKKLNRLLAKFPYDIFENLIQSKGTRKGIKIIKINPILTSYIGIKKYSYRSDITSAHNKKSKDYSASLVIGRRGLGFKERTIISIRLLDKKVHTFNVNALLNESEKDLSITNHCNKSNWSIWLKLKKHESHIHEIINRITSYNSSQLLYA